MTDVTHWADQKANEIIKERGEKEKYVFNSGMSISGKMHIGNLRGELIITSRIQKILENKGKKVEFKGVYYTQDRFKGKEQQLKQFSDPKKAEKYTGWRLIDVPDPKGCHDNWVEHYNSQNDPYLQKFGINVNPINNTDFYKREKTIELVKKFLKNREKIRNILNKFRDRKPYPEDWIPFDPFCKECNRIDETEALEVDLNTEKVKYKCSHCGSEEWSKLEKGKLAWRLEWVALWHVLGIDFEPYGKDHATPGGSRDSCVEICKEMELNYPTGFAFNWVYLKEDGNPQVMTSSGAKGITAEEYLEIADPNVLNYLYLSTKPMKEIYFDPKEIPIHYRHFDNAEKIYFGNKEAESEKRKENIKRNYELAVNKIPDQEKQKVPYGFCSTIAQVAESKERRKEILKRTGHLENPSKIEIKKALERIEKAENWVEKYAPEKYIYRIQEKIPESAREIDREILKIYEEVAEKIEKGKNGQEIQQFIYENAKEKDMNIGKVFKSGYKLILDQNQGPRLGPFLTTLDKDFVVKRLKTEK